MKGELDYYCEECVAGYYNVGKECNYDEIPQYEYEPLQNISIATETTKTKTAATENSEGLLEKLSNQELKVLIFFIVAIVCALGTLTFAISWLCYRHSKTRRENIENKYKERERP